VGESAVGDGAGGAVEDEEAGSGPVGERVGRDEVGREGEVICGGVLSVHDAILSKHSGIDTRRCDFNLSGAEKPIVTEVCEVDPPRF
jgi:hypothetical protein